MNDEFGFMLLYGDFAWVPFVYVLQEWYLIENSPDWSNLVSFGVLALASPLAFFYRAIVLLKDVD